MAQDCDLNLLKSLTSGEEGKRVIQGLIVETFKAKPGMKALVEEVGDHRFMEVMCGEPNVRATRGDYLTRVRERFQSDWGYKIGGLEMETRFMTNYLSQKQSHIRVRIERMNIGLREFSVCLENCGKVRDLIEGECPFFEVGMEKNFLGEPSFRFTFDGTDMY